MVTGSLLQIGGLYPGAGDKLALTANVKKPGFLYIYLSNENDVTQEVYFDDLAIKHVPSPLIQGAEYYPFGLQTSGSFTISSIDGFFCARK